MRKGIVDLGTVFSSEGIEMQLLLDRGGGVVYLRREDGVGATLSLVFFEALLEQIGKTCLSCGVGKINEVDFERPANPTLTCNVCDAEHLVVEGQLALLS